MKRRTLIQGMALTSIMPFSASAFEQVNDLGKSILGKSPELVAQDESYWSKVSSYYDKTKHIVNLEHGYWGKMARPVQDYYLSAIKMVNAQNSFYARKDYETALQFSVKRVADALGVNEDEIVLTRNATESIHNLIRQYRNLQPNDAVLFADLDYPSYKTIMSWLKQERKVKLVKLDLPSRSDQASLLKRYNQAFDDNPNLKMMLLTHVSNQHGMILPVREIIEEARKRGIDVICDNAQSWGLLDYKMPDLNIDFAGFNLHKWIGAPVGVGALYIRKSQLHKIAPYPGERDDKNTDINKRVHLATSNFAAMLSVPSALDFHQTIGEKNKQARLNYLRDLWVKEVESLEHIEILGGTDEQSRTGMGSFRIIGQTSIDDAKSLQQTIERDFGIFTVVREGLSSGGCVRVTPQVFTTIDQIKLLVRALKKINRNLKASVQTNLSA